MYGKRKHPGGGPGPGPRYDYGPRGFRSQGLPPHRGPPPGYFGGPRGPPPRGPPPRGPFRGPPRDNRKGGYGQPPFKRGKTFEKRKPRHNEEDEKVAEALKTFQVIFEEEGVKQEAAKQEAAKAKEEAAASAAETPAETTEESKAEADVDMAAKEEAVVILTTNLGQLYRDKTERGLKDDFKGSSVKDFLSEFPHLFVAISKGTSFRQATEEERVAALEQREAEKVKQEQIKKDWAANREAKKAAVDLKFKNQRKGIRKDAVYCAVACNPKIDMAGTAVRRAVKAILDNSKTTYSAIYLTSCPDSVKPVKEQPIGDKVILTGAHDRLKAALARKVLLPTMVRGSGPMYDAETQLRFIKPEELTETLAQEKKERDERIRQAQEAFAKKKAEREAKAAAALAAKLAKKQAAEGGEKTEEKAEETTEEKAEEKAEEPVKMEEEPAANGKTEEEDKGKARVCELTPEEREKKDKEDAESDAAREMVVADYYIAIETGLVKISPPPLGKLDLPVSRASTYAAQEAAEKAEKEAAEAKAKEEKAAADAAAAAAAPMEEEKPAEDKPADDLVVAEKKEATPAKEPTELQKLKKETQALMRKPLDLPEWTAEDRELDGDIWQETAWIVIYCSRTGMCTRVQSGGLMFPREGVAKAQKAGFAESNAAEVIAADLKEQLSTEVSASDPHIILTGRVVSRGNLLEQAVTVGLSQLAQKELARNRVAIVARKKEVDALHLKQKELRQQEAQEKAEKKKAEQEKKQAEAAEKKAAEEEKKKEEAAKAAETAEATPMTTEA